MGSISISDWRPSLGRGRTSSSRFNELSSSDVDFTDSENDDYQPRRMIRDDESDVSSVAADFFEYVSKRRSGDFQGGNESFRKEGELTEEPPPSAVPPVHPLLSIQECFYNWIPEEQILNEDDALHIARKLDEKYANYTDDWTLKALEDAPFETISHKLIASFSRICLGDLTTRAADLLKEVEDNLKIAKEKGFISPEYHRGFLYLKYGLEAYRLSLLPSEEDEVTFKVYVSRFLRFGSGAILGGQALLALISARAYFYSFFRWNTDLPISLFHQLSEKEPNTIAWKLSALFLLRRDRRESFNDKEKNKNSSRPSNAEKSMITEILRTKPDCAMTKIAVLMFVGDSLRSGAWRPGSHRPLFLNGTILFKDLDDFMDYWEPHHDEIVRRMDYSANANLNIAEVFGILLPVPLQNVKVAKFCLERVVEINPHASKGWHRLAMYYRDEEDYEKAVEYSKKGFEYNTRNFPALMETLHLMLKSIDKYGDEFKRIVQEQLLNKRWSSVRRGRILVIYGLMWLMEETFSECINAWTAAFELHQESWFQLISYARSYSRYRRYGWDSRRINPEMVREFLEESFPLSVEMTLFLEHNRGRATERNKRNDKRGANSDNWRVRGDDDTFENQWINAEPDPVKRYVHPNHRGWLPEPDPVKRYVPPHSRGIVQDPMQHGHSNYGYCGLPVKPKMQDVYSTHPRGVPSYAIPPRSNGRHDNRFGWVHDANDPTNCSNWRT